ncbi:MAG: cation:dicarboxylase symporter family transporter [Treponema sp.]|jgi:L-cystine uptake protein TcyP (sodium:dicarboxylate symporter family)|nr:cation:dicarboxylase symporter family transporter [Treponema sp.]
MQVLINIVVMLALLALLFVQHRRSVSFMRRVLTALVLGIAWGIGMQLLYGTSNPVTSSTISLYNIIGTGYTRLLQMVVIPLVFVSITTAITNLKDPKVLGKYGSIILAVLLATTAASALITVFVTSWFNLDSSSIAQSTAEANRMAYMETTSGSINSATIAQRIIEIIPTNVFNAFSGNAPNSTLGVVLFSILLGVAILSIRKKFAKEADLLTDWLNAAREAVMKIVSFVISLTPYGILALMTRFMATQSVEQIAELGTFVLANYVALAIIFAMHLIILLVIKCSPLIYVKKSITALAFAFTSRSSAATLPLTISTQVKKLGVPQGVAGISSSLGTSIGQNGCAGMYPAMLAVMIAPTVGINPFTPGFIIPLVLIVTISSFGIAGVGGGATMAALVVLSAMNLPVALAGLLISIEPLIDMGRTLVNVSDSIVAGLVTAKKTGEIDMAVYNTKDKEVLLVE